MKKMLALVIVLALPASGSCQTWVARYNGTGGRYDHARAMAVDALGNVYVTGESDGPDNCDYATVKYDSLGVEQWVARYDGTGRGHDGAKAMVIDALGNVYVTGESDGPGTWDDYDYATVKYDSLGVEQWVARYDGPDNSWDQACAIAVDQEGNVYVTGQSHDTLTDYDYATIKYDNSGNQQWARRYRANDHYLPDCPCGVQVYAESNIYVAGHTSGSTSWCDYTTILYDSSGTEKWVSRFDGEHLGGKASAMTVDTRGNVYVTGTIAWGTCPPICEWATVMYSIAGVERWVATGWSGHDMTSGFRAIAVDASRNVYMTGVVEDTVIGCYLTVKCDSFGVRQWRASYCGPDDGYDCAIAMALDDSGNAYVTGSSRMAGTRDDYATVKYDSEGEERWVARYNGPDSNSDQAIAIALDGAGNVYVTGSSFDSDTKTDYVTIKYPACGPGVEEGTNRQLAMSNGQLSVFPNPFAYKTVISYRIPVGAQCIALLQIHDATGRLVKTLVNEEKEPGRHEVAWNAKGLPAGIYFARLSVSENSRETKKLLLVR